MRFKFNPHKSELIKDNPERGNSCGEAKAVKEKPYYEYFRNDDPEQFQAIGWVGDKFYTVIVEFMEDSQGEYYHLVTLWRATTQEGRLYGQHVE